MKRKRKKPFRPFQKKEHLEDYGGKVYKESTPMIVRNVPPKLRLKFKKRCKECGYTMARKIRLMMNEFIKGDRL